MRLLAASLFLLTLLAAAATSDAQSVSGTVVDAMTGEPLPNANVVVQGTTIGTSADATGAYRIDRLPTGSIVLAATFIGYETARREVAVEPDARLQIDFELEPTGIEGEEIVVEALQPLDEARAVGFQEIPIRLVRQIPSAVEDDLFRSLQLLPGVKAASDFSSRLYIRGGSPDQTLILLDQMPVYNPSHFFGFFSIFNIDAIDDVRIWKGGYPVRYGGRLGSVIDVSSRQGDRDRFGGSASIGLLASRLNLEGPLNVGGTEGGFLLAGRRSTLEPVLALLREFEDTIPDGFYFYDANARLDVDLSPRDRLTATVYAGMDDVQFPFSQAARFDLRYGNRVGTIRYERALTDRLSATVLAAASRYWNYPFAEISGTTFERENSVTDYAASADARWLPTDGLTVRAGARAGRLTTRLHDVFDGRPTIDVRREIGYASAYSEASWQLSPWVLSAGLRADYHSRGDFLRLSPRLAVERYVSENVLVQAAYGRYHQFLALVTNEAFTGFDVWVTAAEGVPPSYGDQLTLGVKTRPLEGYAFDVEVYGRTLRDLFEIDPRLQDFVGVDYADLFRFGDGYAAGVELFLERTRGRLTGFAAYTLGITQRRFVGAGGDPFNPDPVTGEALHFSPKYDRLHDLAMVANYELSDAWTVTGSFVYATGQAYTRVTGHYEVNTLPGANAGAVVTSGFNRARLPAYHRLDLGVTRTGRFFGIGDYELRVQAINAYSRRNLWFYFLDQQENPIGIQPARQLPILPNISLTVEF